MDPGATLPPLSAASPDLVYIEPVIPPGVSEDTAFQIRSSARQHFERRQDSRLMTQAIVTNADKTLTRIDKIDADLAAKPGKGEVRMIMAFAAGVFLLMLFAAFQKNGIDSASAVQNTQAILSATTGAPPAASAPVSTPAPSSDPSASQNAPQGNGGPLDASPAP